MAYEVPRKAPDIKGEKLPPLEIKRIDLETADAEQEENAIQGLRTLLKAELRMYFPQANKQIDAYLDKVETYLRQKFWTAQEIEGGWISKIRFYMGSQLPYGGYVFAERIIRDKKGKPLEGTLSIIQIDGFITKGQKQRPEEPEEQPALEEEMMAIDFHEIYRSIASVQKSAPGFHAAEAQNQLRNIENLVSDLAEEDEEAKKKDLLREIKEETMKLMKTMVTGLSLDEINAQLQDINSPLRQLFDKTSRLIQLTARGLREKTELPPEERRRLHFNME